MVKANIFCVKEKNKVYKETKTTYKFLFFYLKDFTFYDYICKMYILTEIKRSCRKSRFR